MLIYKILEHTPAYLACRYRWHSILPTSSFFKYHAWISSTVSVPSATVQPNHGMKSRPLLRRIAVLHT